MEPKPKYQAYDLEKNPKKNLWEKELSRLDKIKDNQDESIGINEGIKQTVAALNINGINTIASDEGHPETVGHGDTHYPWILVEAPDNEKSKIFKLHELLSTYLNEFYSNRETSEDIRLKVGFPYLGQFHLTSVFDEALEKEEISEMLQKLSQRQQEMRDFGEFLKYKFFQNP